MKGIIFNKPLILFINSFFFCLLFTHTVAQESGHSEGKSNAYMHKNKIEDLIKRFDSPERAAWQRPEWVISKMGNLKDKVLVEIGAGSGYFSLRLLDKAGKVIAADVDQRFLDHIENRKKELAPSYAQKLQIRRIPYD
ncbi:MAG: hypothetical protein AAFU64_09035, partial [Bacteroidota bacterium]